MDCKVNYYRNGEIKEVLTPQGTKSKLFIQLAKLPFVKTLSDALEAYKNVYTKKLGYTKEENFLKIVDLFESRLKKAKELNPDQYWSVDEVPREALIEAAKNGRIVDVNGGMGIVTPSGDMKGLFKYDESVKGTSQAVQEARIAKGGIKLDNFDGYLTKLNEKRGFRVVSRISFSEKDAPEGWNKEKHGTPDVVAMVYDPQGKLNIEEKTFVDYNEGMAYRDSYVDEAKALKSGKQNTEFFEGKAKEASSNIPYSPVLNVDQTTPVAKAYALYTAGGNFTGHISKMIAGFQEKQKQVAEAIVKGGFKSFLDIGTSEGGMIKTVASQNKDVTAVGIDPNIEMQKNFNSTPEVSNAEYRLEAFQGSWTEDDGTEIKEFKTDKKFEVVNEDFVFQFVNNNRAKQVAGVKELMTEDGIFITSEKFHTDNEAANEAKKYDHQRKYFSPDQLTEDKQTIVSGMADDMVNDVEYFKTLKENFRFVEEFWNAGNFKGYLASDNNEVLQEFKKNVGDLTSEFTDTQSLTKNTNEPELEFKSSMGNSFRSYKEALLDSNSGDISVGITVDGEYREMFSVSSTANVNTVHGFVNAYIKSGLLSDEKRIENGKSYHQSSGRTEAEQIVNEFIIDEDAKLHIGTGFRLVERDGKITLNEGKGQLTLETRGGSSEVVNKEDLDSLSNEEITSKFVESEMLIVSKAVNETVVKRTFGTPVEEDVKIQLSENELSIRLLGLLEKMGVKVTTISEYIKNSKGRNGVEPNAEGLADIANQIVALKNGEIDPKALTEETSHFIVEAWNEEDISNLLRTIDKTEEYKEFSAFYRELYAKQGLTGEELEQLVRREILGKVLAKSISDNFSSENKTEEQSNIINFISNLFSNFIAKVQQLFSTKDELDLLNFTNQVKDLILNQDIDNYLNLNTLSEKKFVMYQAAQPTGVQYIDTLVRQSKNLIQILQQQERDLLKADRGLKANVNRLREIEQELDDATIKNSITTVLSTAKRQAKYISQAADQANKNNNFLTNEEAIVYHSLRDVMSPTLAEIKEYLLREQSNSTNKIIINEIDTVILEVSGIVGKINSQDNVIMNSIIDRIIARHNLPESAREALVAATKAAKEDTSAFYATFGQLTHARDPLLNMAGAVISDLHIDANTKFLFRTKPLQDEMRRLGFTEKDLKQFFAKGGFIKDIRDWGAFHKLEEGISAKILKDITGVAMSEEDIIKFKKDPKAFKNLTEAEKPTLKTTDQNNRYWKQYRAEMSPYVETVFKEEYYKKEEQKYKDYSISDLTVKERRNLSADRGTIFSRVKDENGRMRFTDSDKYDLNAMSILRKKLKSFFDEEGRTKRGIKRTRIPFDKTVKSPEQVKVELNNIKQSPDILEVNGWRVEIDRNIATNEAIVAFDLNKLDAVYQLETDKNSSSKLSDEFLAELKEIEKEGRDEALEFFRMNAFVNFSEEYWNSIDQTAGIVERLNGVEGGEDIVYRLQESLESRRQIIKQYQSQQDPSDILVEEIPPIVKERILALTDAINVDFLEGLRLLGDRTPSEGLSVSENTPNEAYFNATKGMSDGDKIDFIKKTTSKASLQLINEFTYALDELSNTGKTLTKSKQNTYNKFDSGTTEKTILKYAESKLAPFYVRFAPKGFSEIQNRLENSSASVYDIVTEMNENPTLQITNNFSYEKAEDNVDRNTNYIVDFDGGFYQPKLEAFKDKGFYDLFEPTVVKGTVVSVNKNQKLYELYTAMMDYHRSNLASMGELGTHNVYKAPQISKTTLNKVIDIAKKKDKTGTMRETLRDFLFYRVDDLAYGSEVDGESTIKKTGTKYIPKYYLRDLENTDDISEDLFYSMTAFGQQATLYESRKNAYSDMMAIQESLLKRAYPEGKSAEASATLKMFNSFNDANIFGIKEVKQMRVKLPIIGEVDLTKNIRFIHKWVIARSLGFNAVVPFTSAVTAITQTTIEKYIGEYVNKHSTGLAWKEFTKLAPAATKDIFNVNSTAKLNVLLEYMNIYDVSKRYENSIYSKTMRTLPKVGMALNEAGNFPIIPKVVLSVLYDYRVVGDKIIHFKQFEEIGKANNESKAKIESDWAALEGKAIYNYMDVSTSTLKYDLDRMKKDMDIQPGSPLEKDSDFEKYVYEKEKAIISRTREIVKRVDGQIPEYERSEAQRHVFLSYLTTFRGWLTMAYAYRFKNTHFNLQSGIEEEGSYRSAGSFLSDAVTNLSGKGFGNFLKDIKEQWVNASDIERSNIRRVLIEISLLQAVVAVGWMIAQAADDDDNKDLYALQLTNYLYARLMNESTSAQLAIGSEFYGIVESPIVGADTVSNIFALSNYYDTTKIEGGRYSGMYKFQKQFMSVVPGYKSMVDMQNPKDAYSSYIHFNKSVDTYNPVLWLLKTLE